MWRGGGPDNADVVMVSVPCCFFCEDVMMAMEAAEASRDLDSGRAEELEKIMEEAEAEAEEEEGEGEEGGEGVGGSRGRGRGEKDMRAWLW